MVEKSQHSQALHFIEAFPEAHAFHVVLLTQEKRATVVKPQCSRQELLTNLQVWLSMKAVHFFIRPLLRSLVMVDLDDYKGDLDIVLRLNPRALVCTRPGNYQGWWTVSDTATRTATWVMSKLTEALGGDTRSAKPTQQGRLPGSVNVKPGKGQVVSLLHSSVQNLNEEVFLRITSKDSLRMVGDNVTAVAKAPPRSLNAPDHSRADWCMCCAYFEKNPKHSVEQALVDMEKKFLAQRPNQTYYQTLTVKKARDKVVWSSVPLLLARGSGGASSSGVPAKSPPDQGQQPHAEAGASRALIEPVAAAPPVSVAVSRQQVEELVADALRKRFGHVEEDKDRLCSGCQTQKTRKAFGAGQWGCKSDEERRCLVCKPMDERLQKRAKESKECAHCGVHRPRQDYTEGRGEQYTPTPN